MTTVLGQIMKRQEEIIFFEYKTKIIGSRAADNSRLVAEVAAPLKYLRTFWRSINLPLINC